MSGPAASAAPPVPLLVGAFGFAFSPLLADLASHWLERPWARYSLVFAPLLWVAVRGDRRAAAPARDGWLWMGAALCAELLAVGAGYTRLARPALPLGWLGLCRSFGLASWPVALLALWLVPVPSFLVTAVSPGLESTWLRLGAIGPAALGMPVSFDGAALLASGAELALAPWDSGVPLAALLSGLGWYAGLRAGAGPGGCLVRAATWGACAFAVQALGVVAWVALRSAGSPQPPAEWLTPGLAILCAALALFAIEGRSRRSRGEPREVSP